MQIRFRLAEVLNEFRDTGRGIIKRISEETGLERHQVSALLKNDVQYLSLNSLGAICDYLINTHHMNSYELPGRLFALEPEKFWAFLSERQVLVMSFGVRHEMHDTGLLWIPAADSFLQGMLLHELYGTEQTPTSPAEPLRETQVLPHSVSADQAPRFDQYMVRCCSTRSQETQAAVRDAEFQQMKWEATSAYERFDAIAGSKALVCLGSVKSNGLCELAVARVFSTPPWVSQDGVSRPVERACPFFLRYRDSDVNVTSCHGGRSLAADLTGQTVSSDEAGIYFEREPGIWDVVPSNQEREPALIFYAYRPAEGIAEVVMGGFSMVGTFLLAQHFRKIVREIWPPTHLTSGLQAGAFIVDFQLKPKDETTAAAEFASDLGATIRELEDLEVIRLPAEVLTHRLEKSA